LKDQAPIDQAVLSNELVRYFRGLGMAIGGKKYGFDPAHFKAEVVETILPIGNSSEKTYRGRVESYDPFATGKPIILNLSIQVREYPGAQRRAILFSVSPQPESAPIWDELKTCVNDFRCQ